jgi:hypothetical protein
VIVSSVFTTGAHVADHGKLVVAACDPGWRLTQLVPDHAGRPGAATLADAVGPVGGSTRRLLSAWADCPH